MLKRFYRFESQSYRKLTPHNIITFHHLLSSYVKYFLQQKAIDR